MMSNKIKVIGEVSIYNHSTKQTIKYKNLVVNTGLALIADRLGADTTNYITHLAIGDDSTPVTTSDTTLNNETFRKIIGSWSSPANVFQINITINADEAIGTWAELGLFNAASLGVMLAHTNVDYTHVSGQTITITWNITFSAG